MAGTLCACFGACEFLVAIAPAFQEIVNVLSLSYCLRQILLLTDGLLRQPVNGKVQGYILNTERLWGKTGKQEGVQLPEVAVALRYANIAVFKARMEDRRVKGSGDGCDLPGLSIKAGSNNSK